MKITKEELKELNEEGNVEIWYQDDWYLLEVEE